MNTNDTMLHVKRSLSRESCELLNCNPDFVCLVCREACFERCRRTKVADSQGKRRQRNLRCEKATGEAAELVELAGEGDSSVPHRNGFHIHLVMFSIWDYWLEPPTEI